MSTELTRGAWVLLPAAFVSGVVGVVLLRKAKAKLDERVERARGRRTTGVFCFLDSTPRGLAAESGRVSYRASLGTQAS